MRRLSLKEVEALKPPCTYNLYVEKRFNKEAVDYLSEIGAVWRGGYSPILLTEPPFTVEGDSVITVNLDRSSITCSRTSLIDSVEKIKMSWGLFHTKGYIRMSDIVKAKIKVKRGAIL